MFTRSSGRQLTSSEYRQSTVSKYLQFALPLLCHQGFSCLETRCADRITEKQTLGFRAHFPLLMKSKSAHPVPCLFRTAGISQQKGLL